MPDGAGLGAYLSQCREARGLSVEDLSQTTRNVPRLLRAIEEDYLFASRSTPAPGSRPAESAR